MDRIQPQEGGNLASRPYGWLAGAFVALAGLGIALIGGITYCSMRSILQDTLDMYEMYDSMGGTQAAGLSPDQVRVFCVVAAVILAAGIVMTIAGAALAVSLRRKRKKLPGQ